MAWQTGPHAQAPQGVLCFPTDVPGEVTWDDEGLEGTQPAKGPPQQQEAHPHAQATTKQDTKHG